MWTRKALGQERRFLHAVGFEDCRKQSQGTPNCLRTDTAASFVAITGGVRERVIRAYLSHYSITRDPGRFMRTAFS